MVLGDCPSRHQPGLASSPLFLEQSAPSQKPQEDITCIFSEQFYLHQYHAKKAEKFYHFMYVLAEG